MFVSKAAVLGGGTMGGEIAQVIAAADIPVVVKDIKQEFVDARAREVARGHEVPARQARLQGEADPGGRRRPPRRGHGPDQGRHRPTRASSDVDIVIEAVPEKMEIKKAVYAELDEATPGHAILASNTSSLSITEMGRETLRPGQVVGFHFFSPGLGDAAG